MHISIFVSDHGLFFMVVAYRKSPGTDHCSQPQPPPFSNSLESRSSGRSKYINLFSLSIPFFPFHKHLYNSTGTETSRCPILSLILTSLSPTSPLVGSLSSSLTMLSPRYVCLCISGHHAYCLNSRAQ